MSSEGGGNKPNMRLYDVYASRDIGEVGQKYDAWAEDYDNDITGDYGWPAPGQMADVCSRYATLDSLLLDAGAGTGLTGSALRRAGFYNIIGIDLSAGMLEVAKGKSVYSTLYKMKLGAPLAFEDGAFDAVVSVGALTISHASADSLDELVRVTRPGGHLMYTLRPDFYRGSDFPQKHAELEQAGRWRFVEVTKPFAAIPLREPDVDFQIWVFEALG